MPKPNIEARAGRELIAMGPNAWAKGADSNTALQNLKKHLPSRIWRENGIELALFDCPPGTVVDGMGYFRWPDGELADPVRVATVKISKGRLNPKLEVIDAQAD